MVKLLILYKVVHTTGELGKIFQITDKYAHNFPNVDCYYLVCDNSIDELMKIDGRFIYYKMVENNWESLLIKVVLSFIHFMNSDYTHVIVSNISTFINIKLMYSYISSNANNFKVCANIGNYSFKNISYKFPSGACMIFNMDTVKFICSFFIDNKFIVNNELIQSFKDNYPTTDDIFVGYFCHINKIMIDTIDRCDIYNEETIMAFQNIPTTDKILKYTHYRIKANQYIDYQIHQSLANLIN